MTAMEFVENQARPCRADSEPIKETDLTRNHMEKALAENYELKTTITTMKTREYSKANALAMIGLEAGTEGVKKVRS